MRAPKSLTSRVVRALVRKTALCCDERATAVKPVRRAHRVQYLTLAFACVTVLAVYSQLLGRDPIPPQNPPNLPPSIEEFVAVEGPASWTFVGQVLDENPAGLVITFGGLLDGHHTTVRDSQGHFWYSVKLQSAGIASAHTIDDHAQGSNYAYCAVE
jgi:hypothetical protein